MTRLDARSTRSRKFGHRRTGYTSLAAALCALAVLGAPAAFAQSAADQEDNQTVNNFFRLMKDKIKPGPPGETVQASNGRVSAGYYQIRITAAPNPADTSLKKGCKAAIATLGNDQIMDAIFNRHYDMGMAVSLPMALQPSGTAGTPESRAEINLFRLLQDGGRRCTVSLSYFEKQGDYTGPWIPIDHQALAIPQEAVIKFRPWVSRENNKARVDAFWAGLGGFVSLLGPVATIGSKLFSGGKDEYEIKDQARATLFSFTKDVKTTDPVEATVPIVVSQTVNGTSFTPKSFAFDWNLVGTGDEPFTYNMHYVIDVRYWASRLFDRQSTPAFPDLSGYDRNAFVLLLGRSSVAGGAAWNALSEPVIALAGQKTPQNFQIACKAAFADLKRLGFSREDQVLMVYGTAVASGMTPAQIRSIDCLFGDSNAPEVTEKLAKFHIAPPPAPTPVLDKTVTDQWYAALLAGVTAFQAPAASSAPNANFKSFLAPNLQVGGSTDLIVNSANKPVLGSDPTPYTAKSSDFLALLKTARPMVAGCYSPRKSSSGAAIDFDFPDLSGLAPSDDRSLAFLAETGGKVFMVVLGIAGRDGNANPVIDQIWFGDTFDSGDVNFRGVVDDMLKSTDSTCVTRPAFKAFLDRMKQ